jgi:ribonuclease P protein component
VANPPPDDGAAPRSKAHVPDIGVLRGAEQFTALLSGRPVARTEHFAAYHRSTDELSTSTANMQLHAVDGGPFGAGLVLGFVIPKRHAKRAVTRVAIRRQMRAAVARHGAGLAAGEWALRLRVPWDPKRFRSATSAGLVEAVRAELDVLLVGAAARRAR